MEKKDSWKACFQSIRGEHPKGHIQDAAALSLTVAQQSDAVKVTVFWTAMAVIGSPACPSETKFNFPHCCCVEGETQARGGHRSARNAIRWHDAEIVTR